MEERRTKPVLSYLLNKITTPLLPTTAFTPTALPPLFLSPCSLTLGANSCSLINYWCSEAVGGLAGSGFQKEGVGEWGVLVAIPMGQAKRHPSLCLCVSVHVRARLTTAVTVISSHLSVRLASHSTFCFYNVHYWLLRDRASMQFHRQQIFKCKLFAPHSRKESECISIGSEITVFFMDDFKETLRNNRWKCKM